MHGQRRKKGRIVGATTTRRDVVDDGGGSLVSRRDRANAASRSVGVADSNGRRSVSRLLRGSYVNMETGSWNPVLDSTYDSNQRG